MSTETKKCPYCGELINSNAIKCKHCFEFLNQKGSTLKKNRNFLRNFFFYLIMFVIGIMLFSNPSKEKHYEAVKSIIYDELNRSNSSLSALLSISSFMSGNDEFSKLASQIIDVHNYLIFSTTNIAIPGEEEKNIGFGAFNNVFLFDSKFNDKKMSEKSIETDFKNLSEDFVNFIKEFSSEKHTQVSLIKFPFSNSNDGKKSFDKDSWSFYDKSWFFEGNKTIKSKEYCGHFEVINKSKIEYALGYPSSDILIRMTFEKINGKWIMVNYYDYFYSE